MLLSYQFVFSLLLPTILCGSVFLLVAYLWKQDCNRNLLQWLIAAGLGIGYLIGHIVLEGKLALIPKESRHWIFYLTIVAIGSSSYWHIPKYRSLISQLFYSILVPRILLNSYYQYSWDTYEGVIWWLCLSTTIFVFFKVIQQSFHTLPSNATIPFVYLGLSVGTALILALSGSLLLAFHSSILVALFAVFWILSIVLPRLMKFDSADNFISLQVGVSPVLAILFVSFWLNGYFYAEMPAASVLLLVIAPLFSLVIKVPIFQKIDIHKAQIVQVGLIALSVCSAIGIAVIRSISIGESTY